MNKIFVKEFHRIMAEYLIPEHYISDLHKKVKRIINKGAHVIFNVLEQSVPVKCRDSTHTTRYIKCDKIEVSGEYKINGWVFVATIKHGPEQNIINVANKTLENNIPAIYRTANKECEYCHIKRDRNDTYLIYNETTHEWKQVGKTCLREYTQGLNAEACASLVSVINELEKLNNETTRGIFDLEKVPVDFYVEPMDVVKRKAYLYVKDNGYQSSVTGLAFSMAVFRGANLPESTDEEVEQVTNYLENAENSAYISNAWAAWCKRSFEARDGGLITSAIYSYFKNEQKLVQQRTKERTLQNNINQASSGAVGDKVTFTIKDFRVLYLKNINSYYSPAYPVYKIIDTDGRAYIWSCSTGFELKEGAKFEGTIKKIAAYKGEMQTTVIDCKAVE